jgi:hypothetical protein
MAAGGHGPEGTQELGGDRHVGLPLLQPVVLAPGDAASGLGLARAALGGVAPGQLGQAAGLVETSGVTDQGEEVDEADIAHAPDLAAEPARCAGAG